MCADLSKRATTHFIKEMQKKGQRYFIGYKQIGSTQNALNGTNYTYRIGINIAKHCPLNVSDYSQIYPQGIHVFVGTPEEDKREFLPVVCDINDLVGIEPKYYEKYYCEGRQAVLRKIRIRKKDLQRYMKSVWNRDIVF